jgi:hypothetical protein
MQQNRVLGLKIYQYRGSHSLKVVLDPARLLKHIVETLQLAL